MFRPSQNLYDAKICSFTEIFMNDIKFLVQRIKTKCTQFSLKGQNLHWYHNQISQPSYEQASTKKNLCNI